MRAWHYNGALPPLYRFQNIPTTLSPREVTRAVRKTKFKIPSPSGKRGPPVAVLLRAAFLRNGVCDSWLSAKFSSAQRAQGQLDT